MKIEERLWTWDGMKILDIKILWPIYNFDIFDNWLRFKKQNKLNYNNNFNILIKTSKIRIFDYNVIKKNEIIISNCIIV